MLWFYDLKEPAQKEGFIVGRYDYDLNDLPLASECRTDLCTVPGLVAMGLLFPPFCCYFATRDQDADLFGYGAEKPNAAMACTPSMDEMVKAFQIGS